MAEHGSQNQIKLATQLKDLPGIGPRRMAAYRRLEVQSVGDLIRHLPMRYELEFAEGSVRDLTLEQVCSTRGTIVASRWIPGPKGRLQATLEDHSGRLSLTWFSADYLKGTIKPGLMVRVQGKVKAFNGYPQMVNPKFDVITEAVDEPRKGDYLRPVYPATEGLASAKIEELIGEILPKVIDQLQDPVPADLLGRLAMPSLADAFQKAHKPANAEDAGMARRRLAFNELLLLELGIAIKRHYNRTKLVAPAMRWSAGIDAQIRARFPFALTLDQNAVIQEIIGDLKLESPMNRLLQGDVGSGKTIVALYAMLMAIASRKQAAMMAPTELLVEQHYLSISKMLKGSNVRVAYLTGGANKTPGRRELLEQIETGEIDIVIGTQALLTDSVRFDELGVVVIDEQHRFGVLQRAAFRQRPEADRAGRQASLLRRDSGRFADKIDAATAVSGEPGPSATPTQTAPPALASPTEERIRSPHYLVMTATPIPRTLSMTIFGDLDVSTIRGLPPGRMPITTRVVGPEKSDEVYTYLLTRLERGEQVYVVLPTIEESGPDVATPLKSVKEHVKFLQQKLGPAYSVDAVHGQLESEDRDRVMEKFRAGKVHVLVATTVIEVGVDVPNASVMIVEHAERFGLAQLHQLRGRVGRGQQNYRSLCVFIADPSTDDAKARMEAMASTTDGFVIAEKDLEIRGMGDFFGTRQHGLPPLRVAKIPEDIDLLKAAGREAEEIVRRDPKLDDPSFRLLRKVLVQQYGETLGLIDVG